MKLLHTLLFTIAFSGTCTVTAQTTQYNPSVEEASYSPECEQRFDKLKEMHIIYLSSETQKQYQGMIKAFNKKINLKGNGETVDVIMNDVMGWIKANIEKTHFESYEAAEKEFEAIVEASIAARAENKEYIAYLYESQQYCGNNILTEVLTAVADEHPELYKQ